MLIPSSVLSIMEVAVVAVKRQVGIFDVLNILVSDYSCIQFKNLIEELFPSVQYPSCCKCIIIILSMYFSYFAGFSLGFYPGLLLILL